MVSWREKNMQIILKDGQCLERRNGNVFRLPGETITNRIRFEMGWPDGGVAQLDEPSCS